MLGTTGRASLFVHPDTHAASIPQIEFAWLGNRDARQGSRTSLRACEGTWPPRVRLLAVADVFFLRAPTCQFRARIPTGEMSDALNWSVLSYVPSPLHIIPAPLMLAHRYHPHLDSVSVPCTSPAAEPLRVIRRARLQSAWRRWAAYVPNSVLGRVEYCRLRCTVSSESDAGRPGKRPRGNTRVDSVAAVGSQVDTDGSEARIAGSVRTRPTGCVVRHDTRTYRRHSLAGFVWGTTQPSLTRSTTRVAVFDDGDVPKSVPECSVTVQVRRDPS